MILNFGYILSNYFIETLNYVLIFLLKNNSFLVYEL